MYRFAPLSLVVVLACSCGSDSSGSGPLAKGDGGACPDLSGTYTVTQHCDSTLVGQSAAATEANCRLSFAAPFNQFTGSVASDGTVSLSGPQTCTGKPSGNTLSLTCTPGTCAVTLTRK